MRFTPRSRKAWRIWLQKNHATRDEVWLVFYKRHAGKPTLAYKDAVEEALCFGWIDGVKRSVDEERYMHRFSPRRPGSRWSETNRQRVARLEKAGQIMPPGRRAIEAARRKGRWSAPATRISLAVPPEFSARLKRKKRAAAFFESLAPSYQKQFIGWIVTAKRADTKQRRLDEAFELLARGEKLGMR